MSRCKSASECKAAISRALLGIVLLLAAPSLVSAFELDSHYYLRYGLSLATCFNSEESHLIASGDWGMDENRSTYAEMSCIVLTAVTAEGDSTEKLGETGFGLISEDGEQLQLLHSVPPLWSALSTDSGLVAGKLIACFQPDSEQCEAWWSIEKPRLIIEISVLDKGVESVHEIIPIEPEVRRKALEVCDPFGTSIDMHGK